MTRTQSCFRLLYKPVGYTPTMFMDELLQQNPELKGQKYSFFGKLDPMAHGLMIILFGDECRNPLYQQLDKTYQATIVLGITTDTYDQMGKITDFPQVNTSPQAIKLALQKLTGQHKQPYPPYSYLMVRSRDRKIRRPLWWFAQNGQLDQVDIPSKEVDIYQMELLATGQISFSRLQATIATNVSKVKGNFRQEEIINHWRDYHFACPVNFTWIRIQTQVSSGTYIRHLANQLKGFALDIYRTKVGEYTI